MREPVENNGLAGEDAGEKEQTTTTTVVGKEFFGVKPTESVSSLPPDVGTSTVDGEETSREKGDTTITDMVPENLESMDASSPDVVYKVC